MTVTFRYFTELPATKPPDAIMYKSNPHTARVWHRCWAEIETTTQFDSHPQWGFNKLPENTYYRHSRKIKKKQKKNVPRTVVGRDGGYTRRHRHQLRMADTLLLLLS